MQCRIYRILGSAVVRHRICQQIYQLGGICFSGISAEFRRRGLGGFPFSDGSAEFCFGGRSAEFYRGGLGGFPFNGGRAEFCLWQNEVQNSAGGDGRIPIQWRKSRILLQWQKCRIEVQNSAQVGPGRGRKAEFCSSEQLRNTMEFCRIILKSSAVCRTLRLPPPIKCVPESLNLVHVPRSWQGASTSLHP